MQIGNRLALDAARDALRDQFDAVWLASDSIGSKESRAIKCAMSLDRCRNQYGSGWIIGKGWRRTAPAIIYAHGGDYVPPQRNRNPNVFADAIDSICNPPSIGGTAQP